VRMTCVLFKLLTLTLHSHEVYFFFFFFFLFFFYLFCSFLAATRMRMHEAASMPERPLREVMRAGLAKHSVQILDFFRMLDVDGTATVNFAEFARCLPRLGLRVSSEAAQDLFDELDRGHSGAIEYRKLQRLLGAGGKARKEEAKVRQAGGHAAQAGEPPSLAGTRTKKSRDEFSPPSAWYWAYTGEAWDRETASYAAAGAKYREARRKARQLGGTGAVETRAERLALRGSSDGGGILAGVVLDASAGAPPVAEQLTSALARRSVRCRRARNGPEYIYTHISISIYIEISIDLSISICICLYIDSSVSVYLSIHFFLSLYLSVSLSLSLYRYPSIYLSVCLSISISVSMYLFIYMSVCLSVYLSICLSLYLSNYMYVYIHIYIYK